MSLLLLFDFSPSGSGVTYYTNSLHLVVNAPINYSNTIDTPNHLKSNDVTVHLTDNDGTINLTVNDKEINI
jgi:hypothetical protein